MLFLFWVLLITMVPPIVIAIPLYQVLRLFGLLNTLPGLVATAISSSILAWNEFPYALLFPHSPGLFTLPIHIANDITEHETLWGRSMALVCCRRCRC